MTAATRRASASRPCRRLTNLSKDDIDLRHVVARQTGWSTDTVVVPVSLTPEVAANCDDDVLEFLLDEEPTEMVYVMPHPLRHDKMMSQAEAIRAYDMQSDAFWGTLA